MNDPLDVIAGYRPQGDLLDEQWPAHRRSALLTRIRETPPQRFASDSRATRNTMRRRGALTMAGVGLATAALLGVELLLPTGVPGGPGPASAATLEKLAVTAERTASDAVGPGQFGHLVDSEKQSGTGYTGSTTLESWIAYDGTVWRHDTSSTRPDEYYRFRAGGNDLGNPSPKFLASLPTDPSALGDYLRSHVSGSTSTDEAVFDALGDALRSGFAPPTFRAAAIRVLEDTDHITVARATDDIGRAAIKVTFTDQTKRPDQSQSIFFDPHTSAILEETYLAPGATFTASYTGWARVDAVPADVLKKAVPTH